MEKQTIEFVTVTKDGIVEKIGHSTILQPKTNFGGGKINWYDESKLLKKDALEQKENSKRNLNR